LGLVDMNLQRILIFPLQCFLGGLVWLPGVSARKRTIRLRLCKKCTIGL
jgi:hypothetical protein